MLQGGVLCISKADRFALGLTGRRTASACRPDSLRSRQPNKRMKPSLAQALCAFAACCLSAAPLRAEKYVSFEWIGDKNYLGEKISPNVQCTRGANYTSADSIMMFERTDKKQQVVLIE
jgi:hypothetical protein